MKTKRFWKGAGIVSAELLVSMSLFTVAISGLVFLIRPWMRKHKRLDLQVFDEIKPHVNEKNTRIANRITYFGSHSFLVPANLYLIFYFLFIKKESWFSIRIAALALSSLGLMMVFKQIFKRKRPDFPFLENVKGLSFPSGHAMLATTCFGIFIYIVKNSSGPQIVKTVIVPVMASAIPLIGFSRVYLRVHYLSDVLMGFLIGGSWLKIALQVLHKIEQLNKKGPVSQRPLLPAFA